MNYITEILHFQNYNRNQNLSAGQISLWHALFAAANRQGLGQPFSVPDQVLITDSGLGLTGMKKAREVLCQKGLIQYRKPSGKRGDKGVYQMVSLEAKGKALVEKNTLSFSKVNQQNTELNVQTTYKTDPKSDPKGDGIRDSKGTRTREGNSVPLYKDKNKKNKNKQNKTGRGTSLLEQQELLFLEQTLANRNLRYGSNS